MTSRVVGTGRVRRMLRSVEPESAEEVKTAITEAAQAIHADMLAGVPKRSGDLARLLTYWVAPNGFLARIGFTTNRAKRRGFYARFIEFGTKGFAARNIPPQPARPFIQPAFDVNRQWAIDRVKRGLRSALSGAVAKAGPRDG